MESETSNVIAILPVSNEAVKAMQQVQSNKWMKADKYNYKTGVYNYRKDVSESVINEMITFYEFSFAYIEKDKDDKIKIYNYFDKQQEIDDERVVYREGIET